MTDKTQELLPVTQVDREAAASLYELGLIATSSRDEGFKTAEFVRSGGGDGWNTVQAFARHRISRSLPGDVGRLVRAANAVLAAMDAYNAENGTHLGGPAFIELGRAIAALTPTTPENPS